MTARRSARPRPPPPPENRLPSASRAAWIFSDFVAWSGSNIRRTTVSRTPSLRANPTLLTPASFMAQCKATFGAIHSGTGTIRCPRLGFEDRGPPLCSRAGSPERFPGNPWLPRKPPPCPSRRSRPRANLETALQAFRPHPAGTLRDNRFEPSFFPSYRSCWSTPSSLHISCSKPFPSSFFRSFRVVKADPKYTRPWLPSPCAGSNVTATPRRLPIFLSRRRNSPPVTSTESYSYVRLSSAMVTA